MCIFPLAISTNESRMCCPAHKAPSIQIVNKCESSRARKLMLHSERCVVPDIFLNTLLGVSQHLSQELSPIWRLPVAFTTHSGSSWAVRESPVLHHHSCSHKSPFNGSSFPSGRFQTAPASTVFMESCFPFSKSPPEGHGQVSLSPQELPALSQAQHCCR